MISLKKFRCPVIVHIGFKEFSNKQISPQKLLNKLDYLFEDNGWGIPSLIWSWRYWFGKKDFNIVDDKCDNGFFANYILNQKNSYRTWHPSHSLCLRGGFPAHDVKKHILSDSPCGNPSPWKDLLDNNGLILLAGCSESAITLTHRAEELIQKESRCYKPKKINVIDGKFYKTFSVVLHRPYSRYGIGRENLKLILKENKDYYNANLLGVPALVFRAEKVHRTMEIICRKNQGQARGLFWWLFRLAAQKIKYNA